MEPPQSQRQLPVPHDQSVHRRKVSSHIIGTLHVGDRIVITLGRSAIIKYIGKLDHRSGIWYGIEFIDSVGEHNGTYQGKLYFHGQDKRCKFIQKSDIRAQIKIQQKHTANTMHSDHSDHAAPISHLNDIVEEKQDEKTAENAVITLKLRCMCVADAVPIEMTVDLQSENIASLKQNIVRRCAEKTRLSIFSSLLQTQSYARYVRLYVLNENTKRVHVQSGNMVNCILKKYTQSFTELTDLNEMQQLDGQTVFVLFHCEIDIKIIFQKSLFVPNDEDESLELVETDEMNYCHLSACRVSLTDKFDKLYSQIMQRTSVDNMNAIKLLSNNFIYNKSMWIEKYIYDNKDSEELCLYFMHLWNRQSARHDAMSTASLRSLHSNRGLGNTCRIKVILNFLVNNKCETYTIYDENQTIKQLRYAIAHRFQTECDSIKLRDEILSDEKRIKHVQIHNNDMLYILDDKHICIKILQSRLSGVGSEHKEFEMQINKELRVVDLKQEIAKILKYPVLSQTLIMKEILSDKAVINELGIKHGDTLRLVYNFGARVRLLANDRRKIPIVSFDGMHRFGLVVHDDEFIYHTMKTVIKQETGIDVDRQELYYRGMQLNKYRQWKEYDNIKFELHLSVQ